MEVLIEKARQIKLALFDVDGVLSDGQVYLSTSGEEYKGFHTQDGLGIKLLLLSGVNVGIISGRKSDTVEQRMKALGVTLIFQGCQQKMPIYESLCQQFNLHDHQIAYTGDDLPDLPLIQRAGLGIAVANAVSAVHNAADWITNKSGGTGAAREVCELIMKAQGTLGDTQRHFYTDR